MLLSEVEHGKGDYYALLLMCNIYVITMQGLCYDVITRQPLKSSRAL